MEVLGHLSGYTYICFEVSVFLQTKPIVTMGRRTVAFLGMISSTESLTQCIFQRNEIRTNMRDVMASY